MRWQSILVALLLTATVAPSSEAQIYNCGIVDVIFLNPDLNERAQAGAVDANWQFFIQFQVVGERANEVAYIAFSFGTQEGVQDDGVCPDEESYTGTYFSGQAVQNYRADTDASDGFFINLNTTLVPDGDYSASVAAFDANDNELGRFWAKAIVKNCNDDDQDGRCGDDMEQVYAHDTTQPWPIILPGDGVSNVNGFTIEVGEGLSEKEVLLNGEDITDQLERWDGRLWDNDLKPGYTGGVADDNAYTAECNENVPNSPQVHDCIHIGESYRWTERELEEGDVLNVRLVDRSGNVAKKDVHVGYGITGGISTGGYPILKWQTEAVKQEIRAGQSGSFTFTIQNLGTETGHPFSRDELQIAPPGWDVSWTAHEPVPSGERSTQTFTVRVPSNATTGTHQVTAGMAYQGQGTQEQQLQQILTIDVIGGVDQSEGADEASEEVETPAGSMAFMVMGLLAAAAIAARRR